MSSEGVATDDDIREDEPGGRPIPNHPDAALFPIEVAYLTGQSLRTLEADRLRGRSIPFFKIGRSVRYRRRDVMEWIEARLRASTAKTEASDQPEPLGRSE